VVLRIVVQLQAFQFIEGVKAENVAVFCLQLHMLVFHDHAGDAVENNLQGALFRLVRGDVKRVPPFLSLIASRWLAMMD
jgi:hypothetical protein